MIYISAFAQATVLGQKLPFSLSELLLGRRGTVYTITHVANMVLIRKSVVLFKSRGYAYGVIYREVWKEDENSTWARNMSCEYRGVCFRVPEDEL